MDHHHDHQTSVPSLESRCSYMILRTVPAYYRKSNPRRPVNAAATAAAATRLTMCCRMCISVGLTPTVEVNLGSRRKGRLTMTAGNHMALRKIADWGRD